MEKIRRVLRASPLVLGVLLLAVPPAFAQTTIPQLLITDVELDQAANHLTIFGENVDNGGEPIVMLDTIELEVVGHNPDNIIASLDNFAEELLGEYSVSVRTGEAPEQFDSHCFGVGEDDAIHECDGIAAEGWKQYDRVSFRWVPKGPMDNETDDRDLFAFKAGPTQVNSGSNRWGDPKWFQLMEDYTIDLDLILEKFPNELARCDDRYLGDQRTMLRDHLNGIECMEWRESDEDAVCPIVDTDPDKGYLLIQDGKLTVRRGYRWDGASMVIPGTEDYRVWPKTAALMRPTLIHDSFYDLLRMYIPDDNDRDRFRKVADCLLYMLSRQDGYVNDKARANFTTVRVFGEGNTEDAMPGWKWHALAYAGPDQTLFCTPPEGGAVTLDSTGTKYATPARTWREDGEEIPGTTDQEQPTVFFAPGKHKVTLDVEYYAHDHWFHADRDDVMITVLQDTVAPVFTQIGDIAGVLNEPEVCGAHVEFDVAAQDDCGCPDIVCLPPSGSFFPVGETTVTCTATDVGRNSVTDQFLVSVEDVEPPVMYGIDYPLTMWPPNHQYRTFRPSDFVLTVQDNCGAPAIDDIIIRRVTSDEPENGNGDGNTMNDIVIAADGKSVMLRSERQGDGNGRVYTLHFEVADASGNVGTASFEVHAADDQHGVAFADGVAYEVVSDVPVGMEEGDSGEVVEGPEDTPIEEKKNRGRRGGPPLR